MFVCTILLVPSLAKAVVIDFQILEASGSGYTSLPSYIEDGFLFTIDDPAPNKFFSSHTDRAGWYAGSTSLAASFPGAVTTLTMVDGGVFDLAAVDLTQLSTFEGGGAFIWFRADVSGGGEVSQTFRVDQALPFQTFMFTGFDDVTAVRWSQDYPYHQFDNLVVNPAAILEPTTLALAAAGLAALGFRRRKQTTHKSS